MTEAECYHLTILPVCVLREHKSIMPSVHACTSLLQGEPNLGGENFHIAMFTMPCLYSYLTQFSSQSIISFLLYV